MGARARRVHLVRPPRNHYQERYQPFHRRAARTQASPSVDRTRWATLPSIYSGGAQAPTKKAPTNAGA